MLNHLHGANLWQERLPRRHEAADPADSYLLDLIEAAQPDYAVTETSGQDCSNSISWARRRF